jgi:hypothetical protein
MSNASFNYINNLKCAALEAVSLKAHVSVEESARRLLNTYISSSTLRSFCIDVYKFACFIHNSTPSRLNL